MGDKEGLGNEKEVTGTGISVIIPVYNAEKYIARCLESVIKQGPVVTEIICVDDGSSDASCHMIEAYQKQDKRVQLIRAEHGGVSRARNIGKRRAKGSYILFVDADDFLLTKKLQVLYNKTSACNADILVFGGKAQDVWHAPEWVQWATNTRNRTYLAGDGRNIFLERGVLPVTWNKLYRRDLLETLEFPEFLTIAEDNVFQFWAFLAAQKIVFSSKKVYVYCTNAASATENVKDAVKEQQHALAIQSVKQKLDRDGLSDKYTAEFAAWKRTVGDNEEPVYKSKAVMIVQYIRRFGLGAALQRGIGKYIIRRK